MAKKLTNKTESDPAQAVCPEHAQEAKWHCGECGKPICKACQPIALNYQVFHRGCVDQARNKLEKQDHVRKHDIESPSLSLKIISWGFIVAGLLLFGLALLALGLSLFSRTLPIRALLSVPVPPSLDSIPGIRTLFNWLAGVSMLFSVGITILGAALLNCVAVARRVVLVFSWLEIGVAVLAWMIVLLLGSGFWEVPLLAIFFIWYFTRKNVKRQFEKVL